MVIEREELLDEWLDLHGESNQKLIKPDTEQRVSCDNCGYTIEEVSCLYRYYQKDECSGCSKCIKTKWLSNTECPNCNEKVDAEHEMKFYINRIQNVIIGCEDCMTIY